MLDAHVTPKSQTRAPILARSPTNDDMPTYGDFVEAKGTGNGSPKRPHERAGHERHLADGRVVLVRPCEIHKGKIGPTQFVVRP